MIRAVGCSARTGDRVDAAVSAVAQDWPGAVEQMGDGAAGHDDIIAVTGPARANGYDAVVVGVDEDLGVDAAAVVLTDRGDRLVVHRDQGGVDDPRVCAAVGSGRSTAASTGIRWSMIRSRVDWLVASKAASARVVRLVGKWVSTNSSRTGSGSPQGRPAAGGIWWAIFCEHTTELVIG